MTITNTKKKAIALPSSLDFHKVLQLDGQCALIQLKEEGQPAEIATWFNCPYPVHRIGERTFMIKNNKQQAQPLDTVQGKKPIKTEGRHVLVELNDAGGIAEWYLLQRAK